MAITEQSNVVANKSLDTVFFQNGNLAYNWKTNQWTRQPAWASTIYYELNDSNVIGLVKFVSNTPVIGDASGTVQTATITTGASNLNTGGRAVVNGVRPLINGGTVTIKVGEQDYIGDTVVWSTATALNSRSRYANFRSEGKWHRAEFTIASGFTTALGGDVDFTPQGRV